MGYFEDEFADQPEEQLPVAKTVSSVPQAEQEDSELADVDLRLEVADFYRAILGFDMFEGYEERPGSVIVSRELKAFVKERLEVLLGLRAPKEASPEAIEPQFSEDEAKVLKAVAQKFLKKPSLLGEAPAPVAAKAPVVVAKPVPARPKPVMKALPAPAKLPSTKETPKAPAKEVKKAEAKPVVKEAKKKPAPKPGAIQQELIKPDGTKTLLTEGELIEEEGRRYRVTMNDQGLLYRKDLGQQIPAGHKAAVSPQQLAMQMEQHAMGAVSAIESNTALAAILKGK